MFKNVLKAVALAGAVYAVFVSVKQVIELAKTK